MAGEFQYLTDPVVAPDPVDPAAWNTVPNWQMPTIGDLNQTSSDFFNADNVGQANAMFANLVPANQAQQAAAQWGSEFDEAGKRWRADFAQNQQNDFNSLQLSREQQALANWTARQQAGQWEQSFQAQGVNDAAARDLAYKAQALAQQEWQTGSELNQAKFEEQQRAAQVAEANAMAQIRLAEATQGRTLDISERRMILENENAKALQQIRLLENETAREAANLAAYGRSQTPSTTIRSRWG